MPDAPRPRLFIASSTEGLEVARALQEALSRDAEVYLWNDPGIFEISEVTIESLEKALGLFSYAVIVLTPDDLTTRRGTLKAAPRDNLVFELGLFAGRHGRDSVFMVAPQGQELLLPSDLYGVQAAYYQGTESAGGPRPDVGTACTSILRAVRTVEQRRSKSRPSEDEETRFWDDLAEVVVVVFGVEVAPDDPLGRHPRISLRDLEAAQMVTAFLQRRNPRRRVLTFPASARGWQRLLQDDADLVLIGGPVSNAEFARHRQQFGRHLRGKRGRLCRIADQGVFHIGFGRLPPGVSAPPRSQPWAVDRFPSEYVSRDFGFVYSGREEIYGVERRVVAIAGVKGNGTRGAAWCLTQPATHRRVLNPLLAEQVSPGEVLELVVKVEVFNDVLDQAEVVEVLVGGRSVLDRSAGLPEPCELGISCAGCRFGEVDEESAVFPQALLFDLDDTLVDTYGILISPLEAGAAREMRALDPTLPPAGELTALLLELRRHHPEEVEEELRRRFPTLGEGVLAARQEQLAAVPVDRLALPPAVRDLLVSLRRRYQVCLFTTGRRDLQEAKVQRLGLRELCDEIVILDSETEENKEAAIAAFLDRYGYEPGKVWVIGNRLDNEIRAGNRLGIPTVWVRRGEGAGLEPGEETGRPDHVIADVLELPGILDQLR